MNKEQLAKYAELIQYLYEQGHVKAEGDVWVDGELIIDVDDTKSEFGFIGKSNGLMARKHQEVEDILDLWGKSSDPFKRQAAALCPRMLVFIDSQEMWDGMTDAQEALIRKNHNWSLRRSTRNNRAMSMVDEGNNIYKGVLFLNCGNFNFPWHEGREEWLAEELTIGKWINFILVEIYDELAFGSIADRWGG